MVSLQHFETVKNLKVELNSFSVYSKQAWAIHVKTWIQKATPILRDFGEITFSDFKEVTKEPNWLNPYDFQIDFKLFGMNSENVQNRENFASSFNSDIANNSKKEILSFLEGLILKESSFKEIVECKKMILKSMKEVFIVHGQDELAKQTVARFLETIELQAIILHEQSSGGRTIIEKLEHYTNVDFAVVLLTPDDIGARESDKENLKPRARQNVILELGYMMAKLGRNNVCALLKDTVEKPTDYDGVVYVPMDSNDA